MANNEFDLDLDVYTPQSRKIKLCGQVIDVYPPKFKNMVRLSALMRQLSVNGTQEDIEKLKDELLPLVPALKDPDIDISIEQLGVLSEFIFSIAVPREQEMLQKAEVTPDDTKKKSDEITPVS